MKQQACIALLVYINASTFVYLDFVLANACIVVNTPILKKEKNAAVHSLNSCAENVWFTNNYYFYFHSRKMVKIFR
jgi:hypothetical protein